MEGKRGETVTFARNGTNARQGPLLTGECAERRHPVMARSRKSGRDVAADPSAGAGDAESIAGLLDQCEILPVFDETARLRIGRIISAAAVKSPTRRAVKSTKRR
jgi:hypothetical protein